MGAMISFRGWHHFASFFGRDVKWHQVETPKKDSGFLHQIHDLAH
jgi:hypothetical protein